MIHSGAKTFLKSRFYRNKSKKKFRYSISKASWHSWMGKIGFICQYKKERFKKQMYEENKQNW